MVRRRPCGVRPFDGPTDLDDRGELLREWIDEPCDFEYFSSQTDGYNIAELRKIAQMTSVEASLRGSKQISKADVKNALEAFVTNKMGDEEKVDEILPSLDDVGGMNAQKQQLEQIIVWPKKYPSLFEEIGIPLSKGILLYGPSGCGKTLLANAIIGFTKYHTINVKGPELLSKYIGARPNPALLVFFFFDELDSLAPKRGSDSTGVTDRVVNQFLTELDGAEGNMKGVIVLGCTSRIDLIDQALLRPGRFDHHIECSYPSKEDRLSILKVLTSRIKISDDVDFNGIANHTEGWSGADLQHLLTNAQFLVSRNKKLDFAEVDMESIKAVFVESQPKRKTAQIDRIGGKVTLA
ncbi:unnamed protein product [Caenorhabditis auriculariae]|uniref:AAA+ ATPase domain-containing protein n=1 Tax=Caenorhabditis auriculariae TaxID=2777116 RepID=A0A8S1GWV0_9PELO|nr:unnamed protein product [Caenorhabditis auriculariae]